MPRISPTLEGFRVAFRRPSLTLAEISWRWAVGAAATALFLFSILEYLDTLPVTRGDILLLRTRHPILIGQALGHIFHGSLPRIVMALVVVAIALTVFWILAASVGRITTVRGLMDYFAESLDSTTGRAKNRGLENRGLENQGLENHGQELVPLVLQSSAPPKGAGSLGAVLRLNFLRAAVALAAILGIMGAVILVQVVSNGLAANDAASTTVTSAGSLPPPNPGSGLAFLLFFPLAALVFLAWSTLNWFLSLAGMFAVRGSGNAPRDAMGALSAAVAFCRERTGPVFAVGIWTGLTHLTLFVVATAAVSMPLGLAQIVPGRIVLVAILLLTMAYFAAVDWLYMVRLAGYVCIAEMPEALPAPVLPAPIAMPPSGGVQVQSGAPVQTTIDRDEPILSDVPGIIPT
ncbi:MAG TPA: hypothetical protein VIW68_02935 [Candidatus Sulfotelmatobacter sp.]